MDRARMSLLRAHSLGFAPIGKAPSSEVRESNQGSFESRNCGVPTASDMISRISREVRAELPALTLACRRLGLEVDDHGELRTRPTRHPARTRSGGVPGQVLGPWFNTGPPPVRHMLRVRPVPRQRRLTHQDFGRSAGRNGWRGNQSRTDAAKINVYIPMSITCRGGFVQR